MKTMIAYEESDGEEEKINNNNVILILKKIHRKQYLQTIR